MGAWGTLPGFPSARGAVARSLGLPTEHCPPPASRDPEREPLTDGQRPLPALRVKIGAAQGAAGRKWGYALSALRAMTWVHISEDAVGLSATAKQNFSDSEESSLRTEGRNRIGAAAGEVGGVTRRRASGAPGRLRHRAVRCTPLRKLGTPSRRSRSDDDERLPGALLGTGRARAGAGLQQAVNDEVVPMSGSRKGPRRDVAYIRTVLIDRDARSQLRRPPPRDLHPRTRCTPVGSSSTRRSPLRPPRPRAERQSARPPAFGRCPSRHFVLGDQDNCARADRETRLAGRWRVGWRRTGTDGI